MITGYNTDVEHDGVVYHVQTEDKGLDSPLILSLVYVGGAILASKRSPYQDLIAAGFDEATLAERLQRQHRLICAAIHAGRIEDLKRMNQPRESLEARPAPPAEPIEAAPPLAPPAPVVLVEGPPEEPVPVVIIEDEPTILTEPLLQEAPALPPEVTAPAELITEALLVPTITIEPPVPVTESATPLTPEAAPPVVEEKNLYLDLLEERELRAGDFITFRIRVSRGTSENRYAVPDAHVTLKVLGTAFKPLICSARTDQDGVAILFAGLPRFTSGRAAILVRADANGQEAELRRIIQPS